jgi:hypothetical protein
MAPTRSSRYVCRLLGSIWKTATRLPRPSHKCYLRAAHRRRQGPQACAASRSGAKSLDEAEHSSTLTMWWPNQREYRCGMCAESGLRSTRDLQRGRTWQRTCKRRADHADNARVIAIVTPGREQPPEQGSGSPPCADRGVAHAPHHSARAASALGPDSTERRPLRSRARRASCCVGC